MTELQMGLIGLGAAAVVLVVGYNKWQERKHRKLAEQVFKAQHNDVLLGDGSAVAPRHQEPGTEAVVVGTAERREPMLGDAAGPVAAEVSDAGAQAAVAQAGNDGGEDVAAGELPSRLLDPRLDFIVVMELVEAVPAAQVLLSQRDALQKLAKPVIWVGFNERTREWETMTMDAPVPYRRLRIGLQLADRRGPAGEADLAVFASAMQALADDLMAVADMPSRQVLEQALELDRFCADVDLEIGVNLISRGTPFSGTKVRALAEAAGMVLGEDGFFTRYDDGGRIQFRLQNYESTLLSAESIKTLSTHGLTFLLDVPRVDHGERVFHQMLDLARRFGDTLQGALVDDNRQALSDAQLDHIRREFIVKPQATMAQYGLPAGSPQALRLFS